MEKDQSHFPMLQTLITDKQPYEQLWTTALTFQNMSEEWKNGRWLTSMKHLFKFKKKITDTLWLFKWQNCSEGTNIDQWHKKSLVSHWSIPSIISLQGPFLQLDAEKISDELDIMWRTMHKLTKSLSNLPGPCHVARSFKSKIDQFKQHLPILRTICNPGIKDRHWQKVSWNILLASLDRLTLMDIQCQIHC